MSFINLLMILINVKTVYLIPLPSACPVAGAFLMYDNQSPLLPFSDSINYLSFLLRENRITAAPASMTTTPPRTVLPSILSETPVLGVSGTFSLNISVSIV